MQTQATATMRERLIDLRGELEELADSPPADISFYAANYLDEAARKISEALRFAVGKDEQR